MHIQEVAVACLALVPAATAFYPYERPTDKKSVLRHADDSTNTELGSSHTERRAPSFTLPLQRVRRDNKYNIVTATQPTQSNSAGVEKDGTDLSYMVSVTIGDSKEEYHMLLDSAASNTWVMGEECQTSACAAHNIFGNTDSKSLKVRNPFINTSVGIYADERTL